MDTTQTDLSISTEIKLYYNLHLPENLEKPAPLMIAVHGYGAHKRYMMREARLTDYKSDELVALCSTVEIHTRQTAIT